MPEDTEWYAVEDIYEQLGKRVPMDTIRSWVRWKSLPAYKMGRTYFVKREDFEQFNRDSRGHFSLSVARCYNG